MTRDLARALREMAPADLTPGVLAAARALLVDHLACAAAGASLPSTAMFADGLAAAGLPEGPLRDAMAAAVAAHGTEFDDLHNASSAHVGVVVFPALLATAAGRGAGDEDALLAIVRGYEAMCRTGRAAGPVGQYRRHFHPTATTGAVGAAATAGSLLGLDEDALTSALGIAATRAAGTLEFLAGGAWTKRAHPAFALRDGLEAAHLAAAGFRGPEDGIAGRHGLLAAHAPEPRPALLARRPGDPLEVTATSIKAHACCRYKQPSIDAVLALVRERGIGAGDVERVTIGLSTAGTILVGDPIEEKRRPASVVDAQFSMPYGAAVALVAGRASLPEYSEAMIADPRLRPLMDRVELELDTALDEGYPDAWRGWARIETADGAVHEARVDEPKGDPGNPLTEPELREKYDSLTGADPRAAEIWSAAMALGDGDGLARLLAALGRG